MATDTKDGFCEIETSRIVRPERFITPEVSGLAVPARLLVDGKSKDQWLLYLQWSADGKRECRQLTNSLDLQDGGKLWLQPIPRSPEPGMFPTWSAKSREEWLKGKSRPDLGDVYLRLYWNMEHYIDWPKDQIPGTPATLTLWVMFTYLYPIWNVVPYISIGGQTGCGKSTLLELLQQLVFRPFSSANVTVALVFRTLHERGGVLLYDEAEQLKDTSAPGVSEIMAILCGGNKRGGSASRLEKVGDKYVTRSFDVFGPKALACIRGLGPTLANRCIPVTMMKAPPDSPVRDRKITRNLDLLQEDRDLLHEMALGYGSLWLQLPDHDAFPDISGRDGDIWQPIGAVAAAIESEGSSDLVQAIAKHARQLIAENAENAISPQDETLLQALASAFRQEMKKTPGDLLTLVQGDNPELFPEKGSFSIWNAKRVSTSLGRLGLKTGNTKTNGYRFYEPTPSNFSIMERLASAYSLDLDMGPSPEQESTLRDLLCQHHSKSAAKELIQKEGVETIRDLPTRRVEELIQEYQAKPKETEDSDVRDVE